VKLKLLQKGKKEKVSRQVLCFMQLSNTTLMCKFGNAPKEEEEKIFSRFACFALLLC
jgi:hypothetical protein